MIFFSLCLSVQRVIPPKKQHDQGNGDPGKQSIMTSGMYHMRGSQSGIISGMISMDNTSMPSSGNASGGIISQTKGVVGTVAEGIGTGIGTVADTVADGIGVGLADSPFGYIGWLFVLEFPVIVVAAQHFIAVEAAE